MSTLLPVKPATPPRPMSGSSTSQVSAACVAFSSTTTLAFPDLYIETTYGRVHGKIAGAADAHVTVIAIHGDGGKSDWKAWEPIMIPLASQGLKVVSLSMPGFGESSGSKIAFRDQVAGAAVIKQVIKALHVGEGGVVLVGRSVGGKVMCQAAATLKHVKALVLTHPVRPADDIQMKIKCPTFVTWAKDDAFYYLQMATLGVRDAPKSAGHPYGGPHGAKWFVKTIPGCSKSPDGGLLSWTEKNRCPKGQGLTLATYQAAIDSFYATDYCDAVMRMLRSNGLLESVSKRSSFSASRAS